AFRQSTSLEVCPAAGIRRNIDPNRTSDFNVTDHLSPRAWVPLQHQLRTGPDHLCAAYGLVLLANQTCGAFGRFCLVQLLHVSYLGRRPHFGNRPLAVVPGVLAVLLSES